MKTGSYTIFHLFFISVILCTGCRNLSPEPLPEITNNSTPALTPAGTPETTSVPGNSPETTPSGNLSASPSGIPESTPGAETSATPPAAVTGEATPVLSPDPSPLLSPPPLPVKGILITEIMYNPDSPDSDWEWIEVFNTTGDDIVVSGWVIDDSNGTFHASPNIVSGMIPAGGTGILFNSDAVTPADFKAAWSPGINLIGVNGWGAMGLNNSGDKIGIWDSFASYKGDHIVHKNALCTLEYSNTSPWPVNNGACSVYLKDIQADMNDGKNWVLSRKGVITPAGTCYQSAVSGTNTGADIGSP